MIGWRSRGLLPLPVGYLLTVYLPQRIADAQAKIRQIQPKGSHVRDLFRSVRRETQGRKGLGDRSGSSANGLHNASIDRSGGLIVQGVSLGFGGRSGNKDLPQLFHRSAAAQGAFDVHLFFGK